METNFLTPLIMKSNGSARSIHYIKRYVTFIQGCRSKNQNISGYTETHHILPKSMWPLFADLRFNKWNGAKMTARQHYIAHWILARALSGKMWFAFNSMCKMIGKDRVYKVTSIAYAELKENYSREMSIAMSGEGNGFFGKTHTEETKKKIGKLARERDMNGERNPNYHNRGEKSPIFGRKNSKEHVDKLKKSLAAVEDVTCPVCGLVGKPMIIKRWHFENCGSSKQKVGGAKNPNASTIIIYNEYDVEMFVCEGNFGKTCKENNLPFKRLMHSYRHGGERIYQETSPAVLAGLAKSKRLHTIGWYAVKLT